MMAVFPKNKVFGTKRLKNVDFHYFVNKKKTNLGKNFQYFKEHSFFQKIIFFRGTKLKNTCSFFYRTR